MVGLNEGDLWQYERQEAASGMFLQTHTRTRSCTELEVGSTQLSSRRIELEMHHLRDSNGKEMPMKLVSYIALLARNLANDSRHLILLGNILNSQSVNADAFFPNGPKFPNRQA